jgi:hypothetical protein
MGVRLVVLLNRGDCWQAMREYIRAIRDHSSALQLDSCR